MSERTDSLEGKLVHALAHLLSDWCEYVDIECVVDGPEGYSGPIEAENILHWYDSTHDVPSASPSQADERGVRSMGSRPASGVTEVPSSAHDQNELQQLAAEVREKTKHWPRSMRDPKPGSDLSWERVLKGP